MARGVVQPQAIRRVFLDEQKTPLALDDGILRAVWLTPDELRSCRARHRSPLVLQSLEDYLAGRRAPLELIHTDASVLQPPR